MIFRPAKEMQCLDFSLNDQILDPQNSNIQVRNMHDSEEMQLMLDSCVVIHNLVIQHSCFTVDKLSSWSTMSLQDCRLGLGLLRSRHHDIHRCVVSANFIIGNITAQNSHITLMTRKRIRGHIIKLMNVVLDLTPVGTEHEDGDVVVRDDTMYAHQLCGHRVVVVNSKLHIDNIDCREMVIRNSTLVARVLDGNLNECINSNITLVQGVVKSPHKRQNF